MFVTFYPAIRTALPLCIPTRRGRSCGGDREERKRTANEWQCVLSFVVLHNKLTFVCSAGTGGDIRGVLASTSATPTAILIITEEICG